jgi:hypothetical protein
MLTPAFMREIDNDPVSCALQLMSQGGIGEERCIRPVCPIDVKDWKPGFSIRVEPSRSNLAKVPLFDPMSVHFIDGQ